MASGGPSENKAIVQKTSDIMSAIREAAWTILAGCTPSFRRLRRAQLHAGRTPTGRLVIGNRKSIGRLEQRLGVRLFHRSTRTSP